MRRPIAPTPWLCSALLVLFLSVFGPQLLHGQTSYNVPSDFATIQEAIDASANGDFIEVSPGVYLETIDFVGKAIAVIATDGASVTTIDGSGCSPCSVVRFASGEGPDTLLEGFTVTGGTGEPGGSSPSSGGGLYLLGSAPRINGCIVTGNTAGRGGGAYSGSANATWTDCLFSDNIATGYGGRGGAGMYSVGDFALTRCIFSDNTANGSGGGVFTSYCDATITECLFLGNENTNGAGGGLYNSTEGTPIVKDCTFIDNLASDVDFWTGGGAIGNSTTPFDGPLIIGCVFSGNEGENGGAILNYLSASTVMNCTFTGNAADNYGGGIFSTNPSASSAGGIPNVFSCTFSGNTSAAGGALFSEDVTPVLTNSVLWNNAPTSIGSPTSVSYSCVEGGWPGVGNLGDDPLFVDSEGADGIMGTTDDDLRLAPGSPCIDVGDNNPAIALPTTDLDGNPRIVCSIVDLGAYETLVCSVLFVRGDTNSDSLIDIVDPVFNLEFLFTAGPSSCLDAHDTNDDGLIDISDVAFELAYLFGAGAAPSAPFPNCGADPTPDSLECLDSSGCP